MNARQGLQGYLVQNIIAGINHVHTSYRYQGGFSFNTKHNLQSQICSSMVDPQNHILFLIIGETWVACTASQVEQSGGRFCCNEILSGYFL